MTLLHLMYAVAILPLSQIVTTPVIAVTLGRSAIAWFAITVSWFFVTIAAGVVWITTTGGGAVLTVLVRDSGHEMDDRWRIAFWVGFAMWLVASWLPTVAVSIAGRRESYRPASRRATA